MSAGVLDQVAHDLLELEPAQRQVTGVDRADVHHHLPRVVGERRQHLRGGGRRVRRGGVLVHVQPGQHEQVLDQRGKPLDVPTEVVELGTARAVASRDVHLRAQRGQGAAQLVGDVRAEAALPVTGRAEPGQHGVECDGQRMDLVARLGLGQPFVLVRPRDPLSGGTQRLHWTKRQPDHAVGDQAEHQQQQRIGDEQDDHEQVLAAGEVGDRLRHDHERRAGGRGRPGGIHPQARAHAESRARDGDWGREGPGAFARRQQRSEPVAVRRGAEHPVVYVDDLHRLRAGDRDRVRQASGGDQVGDLLRGRLGAAVEVVAAGHRERRRARRCRRPARRPGRAVR